jgi:hypothetical protein
MPARPRGWENRPIPKGRLYSDYTKEEIEAKIAAQEKDTSYDGRFNGPHILTDRFGWTARCCGNPQGCKWCANEEAYRKGK